MSKFQNELEAPEYLVDEPVAERSGAAVRRFSVGGIVLLCWQRRRLAGAIASLVLLLTVAYLIVRHPRYAATASLMPPDNASSAGNIMSLLASASGASVASGSIPTLRTPSALFVGILQSRSTQESLVRSFGLMQHYGSKFSEDACKRLSNNTTIAENSKSGIVSLTVEDRDPTLAADLAQGYVAALNRIVTENSTSSARRERIFLEARVQEVNQDLDTAAKALSLFSAKNHTLDVPSQARAMVDAGLKLQMQLAGARSEVAALEQTYAPNNVRLHMAKARTAELEREIAKMNGAGESNGSTIDGSGSYPSVTALPGLAVTFADMQRRVSVDEALWAALTKQYEAAKVQEAKEIPTVRVLDQPLVPQRKSSAGVGYVLFIGFCVAAILSVVAVMSVSAWEGLDAESDLKRFARDFSNRN
ncbi:MAG: Wzz/FepE/Etk N-terminal domain-containing protein [Acidobacteriota bacterium]|nr:Wzz/FepE/Etk N-terminal domain-containing protein [Acidobacteriota bacterium]